jgi:hypothetical protein
VVRKASCLRFSSAAWDCSARAASARVRSASRSSELARTLNNLGQLDLRMSRFDQASDRLRQAGVLGERTSNWAVTSQSLVNLALVE